jgi:hypothetical protein
MVRSKFDRVLFRNNLQTRRRFVCFLQKLFANFLVVESDRIGGHGVVADDGVKSGK